MSKYALAPYGPLHDLHENLEKAEDDEAVGLKRLLDEGLGNQIGLHVCDASPMFDFNLTGFLGEMILRNLYESGNRKSYYIRKIHGASRDENSSKTLL